MKNKNDLYNGLSIELSDECILLNDLSPVNLSDEGIFFIFVRISPNY